VGSDGFVVDLSMYESIGISWTVPEVQATFEVSLKVGSDKFWDYKRVYLAW